MLDSFTGLRRAATPRDNSMLAPADQGGGGQRRRRGNRAAAGLTIRVRRQPG